MRDRIYRIGIELEGGWFTLPTGTRLARDGSVFAQGVPHGIIPGTDGAAAVPPNIGEMPSPPLPVKGGEWKKWVKQYYPHVVDTTCGLHIHMSFRSALHYQLLMVAEYTEFLIQELTQWGQLTGLSSNHPLWPRLRGENSYCRPLFYADSQARTRSKSYSHGEGDRYTFVNYCHGLHQTVECRGLPMFADADTAIAALSAVMEATNRFLTRNVRKEEKLVATVNVPLEASTERIQESV